MNVYSLWICTHACMKALSFELLLMAASNWPSLFEKKIFSIAGCDL